MTDTCRTIRAVENAVYQLIRRDVPLCESWERLTPAERKLFDGFDDFNTACGIHQAFDFECESYQS